MARPKTAASAPADDTLIGVASPAEPLPEIPESAYAPDAKPLEEAADLAKTAEASVAALDAEEKAKLDELAAPIQCSKGHLKGSAKVWEHGSLNFDGTLHGPGEVLLLCPCDISDDEAKKLVELGVLVDTHLP